MLVPRTSVLSDSSMLRSGWAIDGAVREVSSGNIRRAGAARQTKSPGARRAVSVARDAKLTFARNGKLTGRGIIPIFSTNSPLCGPLRKSLSPRALVSS